MEKWVLAIHLLVIAILLGSIFGISFGIINSNYYTYKETMCYGLTYDNTTYKYCYQYCNTSIPECSALLRDGIPGKCHNNTNEEIIRYSQCQVICNNYVMLNVTISFDSYVKNITYDCRDNTTCVFTNKKCYYNNDLNVIFTYNNDKWIYISVVTVLCLLIIGYITINVTLFREFIFQ